MTKKQMMMFGALFILLVLAVGFVLNMSKQSAVLDTTSTEEVPVVIEDIYEDTRKDVYLAELPAVGSCETTKVAIVGSRLEGAPDSGSYIKFENGNEQVSYDVLTGVTNSQVGDEVEACVESLPVDCPAGDSRGIVYKTTNTRTGESWSAPNASHLCGGA